MLRILLTIGSLQLVVMLLQLARTKVLALWLGPELVGVMSVVDKLLAVVAQTLSLSLPFAAVRFLPEAWEKGPGAFRALFGRMRNLLLSLAMLAMVGGMVVTFLAPERWGTDLVPHSPIILVAFLSLPVLVLVPFVQNAIAGRMEERRSMGFAVTHAAVFSLTAIVGVWWKGLVGLYALYALAGTILLWVAVRNTANVGGSAPPVPNEGLFLPPRVWKFSLSLLALTFLAPYAALFVHYRVLSLYSAEAAGWLQAAIGISLAVRLLLGSAHATFLMPNVNRGGTPTERMHWAGEFHRTLWLLVGLMVPPLLLFPHLAIHLLYSSAFLPGAAFVAILVVGEVVALLVGIYQAIVVAFDHIGLFVIQNVLAQLLVLGIAWGLILPYGLVAAAATGLCAQLVVGAITFLFLHRRYGLRVSRPNVKLSLFVMATLVIAGGIGVSLPSLTWGTVALKAIAYLFLVVWLTLFMTRSDRAEARRLLGALLPRSWRLGVLH